MLRSGGHAEHILVTYGLRHRKPALVIGRQDIGAGPLDDAKWGVHLTTDIDARMTAGTARIDEEFQAFLLLGRKRVRVASKVFIEGGIWGDQRCLKRCNRSHHIRHGDGIFVVWVGGLKQRRITRDALEHFDSMLMGYSHLDGVLDGTASLSLQVGRSPVPELGDIENSVKDSRCVAPALLPFVSD